MVGSQEQGRQMAVAVVPVEGGREAGAGEADSSDGGGGRGWQRSKRRGGRWRRLW